MFKQIKKICKKKKIALLFLISTERTQRRTISIWVNVTWKGYIVFCTLINTNWVSFFIMPGFHILRIFFVNMEIM